MRLPRVTPDIRRQIHWLKGDRTLYPMIGAVTGAFVIGGFFSLRELVLNPEINLNPTRRKDLWHTPTAQPTYAHPLRAQSLEAQRNHMQRHFGLDEIM